MSRYIDADALIPKMNECVNDHYITDFDAIATILDAPTIDLDTDVWCEDCKEYDKEHHNCPRFNRVIRTALEDAGVVSVVRCKECVHNYNKTLNHGKMYPRCDFTDWKLSENDYCSRGEREGE